MNRLSSICCISLLSIALIIGDRVLGSTPLTAKPQTSSELPQQIRRVSVKIIVDRDSGSGVIVQQQGNTYTVVTNRHVANRGDNYQIQTHDRYLHRGEFITTAESDDLALLKFKSDRPYSVATVNSQPLQPNEPLFAAGFPANSTILDVASGILILQPAKPLKQAYQLGYSNRIVTGMSGGAIFNLDGEVIGINGRSANPIIPDYQYQDLTYPDLELQQQMAKLSWGIPILRAIELLSGR